MSPNSPHPSSFIKKLKRLVRSPQEASIDKKHYEKEATRIAARRKALAIKDESTWGLALSGGGIRSATFSLGVLQALSKPLNNQQKKKIPLLGRFDYLSTVSGGGYIGGFFCSLFIPRRLRASQETPVDAAHDAFTAMQAEPPGRIRASEDLSDTASGKGPLAWLRENGRYLMPTGSGDYLYAAAVATRNLISLYYVIGVMLLFGFALLAFVKSALSLWQPYVSIERPLLPDGTTWIWVSSVWWLFGAALLLVLVIGAAYWQSMLQNWETKDSPAEYICVGSVATAIIILLSAAVLVLSHYYRYMVLEAVAASVVSVALLALAMHFRGVYAVRHHGIHTIQDLRALLTRWSSFWLTVAASVALLAVVDTVAQTLYAIKEGAAVATFGTGAGLGAAIIWLIRRFASAFEDGKKPAWLSYIPIDSIAGLAGVVLFLFAAAAVDFGAIWIVWNGEPPDAGTFDIDVAAEQRATIAFVLVIFSGLLSWITGQFPEFINLSSLQSFYAARLCRTYLGGSNGSRFIKTGLRNRSVAEPMRNDDITFADYYGTSPSAPVPLAPIHLINVTLNQTVDPAEQLVQRDRKGRSLCVTPNGFAIDGTCYDGSADGVQSLTISGWLGTSGAAFSTGLGRETRLGMSLALGLANVRLGTWWESGIQPARENRQTLPGKLLRRLFKTQFYLFYELFGHFHGLRRPLQYLSDGGHFENTAVYELLRPERNVELIVVCDDGCDPDYRFNDFANLIRLARIDFGVEIMVDTDIALHRELGQVFGTPEDFVNNRIDEQRRNKNKCAVMFNVFSAGSNTTEIQSRIILLKPARIDACSHDLCEYGATHPRFPQEPTSDQFFDEAQWESYRRLGHIIGSKVFSEETFSALQDYLAGNVDQRLMAQVVRANSP